MIQSPAFPTEEDKNGLPQQGYSDTTRVTELWTQNQHQTLSYPVPVVAGIYL